jgi:hypothetical protein
MIAVPDIFLKSLIYQPLQLSIKIFHPAKIKKPSAKKGGP